MAYATVAQVAAGYRTLSTTEQTVCSALLDEASVVIDAYSEEADPDLKKVVSCNMVRRALGNINTQAVPIGATQGTIAAGGYSQSWTLSNGSAGELYLSRLDKKLLGVANKIGTYSPVEEMAVNPLDIWN